jgi:acetyltransferase-like isoleucine patch superfamily enzyme
MISGMMLEHDWFPRPLPANVTLGERSWCYSSFAFLHYRSRRPHGVRVGHDSGIYNGTFFELGPDGEVKIGNYCALVGTIISTNSRVVIGDYSFLAHEVVIADSEAARPPETGHAPGATLEISLGENTWVGARAVLLPGAKVGHDSIIGAAAVVDFEVPPCAIVAGNPARIVGWTKRGSLDGGEKRQTSDKPV